MSNPSYTLHILLANGERDRLDHVTSHEVRALGPLTAVTRDPEAPAALSVRKWKWPAGTWLDVVATSASSTDSLTDETKEHSPHMNEKPAIDVELPRATTIRPTTSAADIVLRDTDSIHVDGRGALIVTGTKGEVKATCAPRHEPIGASTGTPCAACAGSPGWPRVASAMRVTPLPPLRRTSLADAAVAAPMVERRTDCEPPPRDPVLPPVARLYNAAMRRLAVAVATTSVEVSDLNIVVTDDLPNERNAIQMTATAIARIRRPMR